jgi:serine/threonine protein kinase
MNMNPDSADPAIPSTPASQRASDDRARILVAMGEAVGLVNHFSASGSSPPSQSPAGSFSSKGSNTPASDSFPGYEITKELHRGGQGVVYQAIHRATRRKVAIKVMRDGLLASPRDRARFEREIQILGQLKHPGIVAIHDSGTVGPWSFHVMDYVPGQPLDVFLASKGLSVKQTLQLFKEICEAINVAHLRGIIHRDIKPSNIRVDPAGSPRVLDFGLAKVSEFDVIADQSPQMMTVTGQFVGSLPWASPEQAEGAPEKIDIRTDVYSLGVMLYQMLTGRFPYEVAGNMRDVLGHIMHDPPLRPSSLRRDIDDEVQTMLLKCLSKERERRYQSAGELARDIGHYLRGEPIEAKRDSGWYIIRKTLSRYRVRAAVATAFVVVTLISAVALLVLYRAAQGQAIAAEQARQQAEQESARLRAAFDVVSSIMSAIVPVSDQASDKFDLLDAAERKVAAEFTDQPELDAWLRYALAVGYGNLAYADRDRGYDMAEQQLLKTRAIRTRQLGPDHPDTFKATWLLAYTRLLKRDLTGAEQLAREMLDDITRSKGPRHGELAGPLALLGNIHQVAARYDEAIRLHREALDIASAAFGPRDARTRWCQGALNSDIALDRQFEEAEAQALQWYEDALAHPEEGDQAVLYYLNMLKNLYNYIGQPDEADRYKRMHDQRLDAKRGKP